jgi:hypothetical protein
MQVFYALFIFYKVCRLGVRSVFKNLLINYETIVCCPPVQQRHEIAQGVLKIHGLVKKDHGIYECVVSSCKLVCYGLAKRPCAARTRFLN